MTKTPRVDDLTSSAQIVSEILRRIHGDGADAAAERLVMAILELRGDSPRPETCRPQKPKASPSGFTVGDTLFLVQLTADATTWSTCDRALSEGRRCFILVASRFEQAARQEARQASICEAVTIGNIECFVGALIDACAEYSKDKVQGVLQRLVAVFNRRMGDGGKHLCIV